MPDITYIDDYINDGESNARSLTKIYDTTLIGDINDTSHIYRIPLDDFFLKYKDELEQTLQLYSVEESLFYKPKALSKQVYGTTEFWLAILRANNMKSITEFCKPVIYLYEPGSLLTLIRVFFKREKKI